MDNIVFCYGTLKLNQSNHERLDMHKADYLGQDKINGRIYSLGNFPGLKDHPNGKVYGELYEVDDEQLARLDRLENHPHMYERKKVTTESGIECWTYFYNGDVSNRHFIRSGIW